MRRWVPLRAAAVRAESRTYVDAFPSCPRAAPPCGLHQAVPAHLSDEPPNGPQWLHEIKHDGYRIIACKSGDTVRLWSRNGRDWSKEFLAVTELPTGAKVR